MDPCGGTIVNAVFFGGLGAASVLAYQRFNSMRNAMIGIMARFGALYRGIALGQRSYTALDAVLRRWRAVFASWLHRGGELTRFAKDMISTIDAARRRARKVHAEAAAKSASASAAAASGVGSFTSSAASHQQQHATGAAPDQPADGAAAEASAPVPKGTSSEATATVDAPEAASAEPQVVSFDASECVTGQPGGSAGPAFDDDEMMMVTLPVPHGTDQGSPWSPSLPSAFGGGGGVVPDDADLVLVQMPKLPAAATAAIETHCAALAERLQGLDAEAAFETAAALPVGFASTRLAFAGIRWLVNKVCGLLLRRAAEREE
jgi:hypothetical protein